MDYQFPIIAKWGFPCRFPARPPIIPARPSQTHDSPWFLLRPTPRENFFPEFSRAAGKRVCSTITGVGGSPPPQRGGGATAVPGAATQGEVRLPENQLGRSTSSPPDLFPEFRNSCCQRFSRLESKRSARNGAHQINTLLVTPANSRGPGTAVAAWDPWIPAPRGPVRNRNRLYACCVVQSQVRRKQPLSAL